MQIEINNNLSGFHFRKTQYLKLNNAATCLVSSYEHVLIFISKGPLCLQASEQVPSVASQELPKAADPSKGADLQKPGDLPTGSDLNKGAAEPSKAQEPTRNQDPTSKSEFDEMLKKEIERLKDENVSLTFSLK